MSGLAIDADPAVQSPYPARLLPVIWESIIEPLRAPDHEQSVCNFMQGTGCVLSKSTVNDKLANPGGAVTSFCRVMSYLDGPPFAQNDGVLSGRGNARRAKSDYQPRC